MPTEAVNPQTGERVVWNGSAWVAPGAQQQPAIPRFQGDAAPAPRPQGPPSGYTGDERGLRPIPGGPADPSTRQPSADQDPFTRERHLRTAYGATKPVQALQTVQPQISTLGAMARNSAAFLRGEPGARAPTPADDMTMVFTFMKTLDPTSVVREQEYQSAANATSILDQMGNLYNRTLRGEILTPRQRQEFFQAATVAMDGYTNSAATQSDYYRGLATDYELNPDHVAPAIRRPASRVPGARQPSPQERALAARFDADKQRIAELARRPAPPSAPAASAPARVRTSADYARIQPGASYIDPNGVRRTKPEAR